jgi:hypothetical protein
MLALIWKYIGPESTLGKFMREFSLYIALAAVGWVIQNWTGLIGAVNDTFGDKIPAVLLALVFAGAMSVLRAFRTWLEKRSPQPPG